MQEHKIRIAGGPVRCKYHTLFRQHLLEPLTSLQ